MKRFFIKGRYQTFDTRLSRLRFGFITLILSSCGSDKSKDAIEKKVIGFSPDYVPPKESFESPDAADPYFKILEPPLLESYWISSLEMDSGTNTVLQLLSANDRSIKLSFPTEAPDYLPVTILGWAPANQKMIVASRAIFQEIEQVLDISVMEVESPYGLNNFVVSQSTQANTAGFSYFPNTYYQLGSDIFISKANSNPVFVHGLTNYDYEVLVHEIGHALGLKHPFESDRTNLSILNTYEDQTKFTAMSYDDASSTFSGTFRSLDWMTLTKLYGVNENYNPNDNVYRFSDYEGTFVIDGNGVDTVEAANSKVNIFIDLRPGMHSFKGHKSDYITSANQLTISHGSEVENVLTGIGDDIVIGNQLPNTIITSDGDDKIFAGEEGDIIYPGFGSDTIDLSEIEQSQDKIIIEFSDNGNNYDTIYGFVQGDFGDILDVTDLKLPSLTFLPIVDALNVPYGHIDNCLVRVFGEGLIDADSLKFNFSSGEIFENLQLSSDMVAILITSPSQDTGKIQNIYTVENNLGSLEVYQVAQLLGNYLDIDNWSLDNFII